MLNPIPQQGFHHRIERAHQRVEGDRMAREGAAQLKQELVVLRLLEAVARSVWVAEPIDENTAGAVSQPTNGMGRTGRRFWIHAPLARICAFQDIRFLRRARASLALVTPGSTPVTRLGRSSTEWLARAVALTW